MLGGVEALSISQMKYDTFVVTGLKISMEDLS